MDIVEDLRMNHEYCPKEVILAAADEIEKLREVVYAAAAIDEFGDDSGCRARLAIMARKALPPNG